MPAQKSSWADFHDGLRRFSYQPPTVVIQPPTPSTSKVVMVATMMGSVNFGSCKSSSSTDNDSVSR